MQNIFIFKLIIIYVTRNLSVQMDNSLSKATIGENKSDKKNATRVITLCVHEIN